ncbi:hypothetical protein V2J34_02220 [Staphylococcus saccharolyticus]
MTGMNYDYMKLGHTGISQSPQVFMDCQIMELNGEIHVNIDTRIGVFKEAFIDAFTNDYQQCLLDIAENNKFMQTLKPWYFVERSSQQFNEIIQNSNNNSDELHLKKVKIDYNILPETLVQNIVEQCKKMMQVDILNDDDNFYRHGADSLILARLSTTIINICKEHQLTHLNFDNLLRALLAEPTISRILEELNNSLLSEHAHDLEKDRSVGELTLFKEEGQVLKVFFHAGLGTMNCLRYVLEELKHTDHDAIAGVTILNQQQYCRIERSQLVKIISESYAELIVDSGYEDVHLVGYCSGGLIALEVASILMLSDDINVEHVTLIDTSPSPISKIDYMVSEMAFIQNYFITIKDVLPNIDYSKLNQSIKAMYIDKSTHADYDLFKFISKQYGCNDSMIMELEYFFKTLTFEERFEKYAKVIETQQGQQDEINKEFLISTYKTQMASWEGAHMVPTTYIGDVTYLKAENQAGFDLLPIQDSHDFWKQCCIGNFEERYIPGNHYDCVEDVENATYVARLLRK